MMTVEIDGGGLLLVPSGLNNSIVQPVELLYPSLKGCTHYNHTALSALPPVSVLLLLHSSTQ
jgi:hypothetical protein